MANAHQLTRACRVPGYSPPGPTGEEPPAFMVAPTTIARAQQAATILVVWQATGAAPPRTAVLGSGYRWLVEQNFDLDLNHAYGLLLQATREALKRRGHAAAADMLFE